MNKKVEEIYDKLVDEFSYEYSEEVLFAVDPWLMRDICIAEKNMCLKYIIKEYMYRHFEIRKDYKNMIFTDRLYIKIDKKFYDHFTKEYSKSMSTLDKDYADKWVCVETLEIVDEQTQNLLNMINI